MAGLNSAYSIHGVGLSIWGESEVVALLNSRLRRFPPKAEQDCYDVTVGFYGVQSARDHPLGRPAGSARLVLDLPGGEMVYFGISDQLYIDCAGVSALCVAAERRIQLTFLEQDPHSRWLATHPLFTIPLIELLKRRGLYSLHAAGVCVNGKSLLLVGPSGSGKTTLAIALMRAGFDFLGEDTLFLTAGRDGLSVLGFPDEADVTDQTANLFPELWERMAPPESPRRTKQRVRAEDLYEAAITWVCKPAVVVFPRIAHTQTSVLTPMAPDEALLELVPNVLLTEAHSSQAHLDILGMLATESRCYRLETGRDFDSLPALLSSVMK